MYGRRGSICEHFGWTWNYLLHGIPWAIVQRMMSDASRIEYGDKKEVDQITLNDNNVDEVIEYLQQVNK